MSALAALVATTGLLVGGGVFESIAHRRRLKQIPVRVHVNGTRGKSSVSRLIASAMRHAGIRTSCKTTGTLPQMILPDGAEFPVFRPSKPNVIEQLRIVETAVEARSQALVVECMALAPYLQWITENKMIRATHGVITNVREDHLDVMGPTKRDVALALAGMTPIGGKLFTAEREYAEVFENAAADRGSELVRVTEEDVALVTPADLAKFDHVEHAENVALALCVCQDLGVERPVALQGMWGARPDPGAMTSHEIDSFGRKLYFVNGFAANDPQSTEQIWRMALERRPEVERTIVIVNCREDRPDRSRQLGEAIGKWPPADHYLLIGSGVQLFSRAATKAGINPSKLVFAEDCGVEGIFEKVMELAGGSALVMGMANIGGVGLDLARYFADRRTRRDSK